MNVNLDKYEIRSAAAEIYKESCLMDDCDMRVLVMVIEDMIDVFIQYPTMAAWKKIKIDRQRFDKQPYIDLLVAFKKNIYNLLLEKISAAIEAQIEQDPNKAFRTWYEEYTEALAYWHSDLYFALCQHPFKFKKKERQIVQDYDRANRLIADDIWPDTFDHFVQFGEDETLSNSKRSLFMVYAGEIMLHHLGYPEKALPLFEKSKELDPKSSVPERALGEYKSNIKNFEAAREYFLRAISMNPNELVAYLVFGDSYRSEEKWSAAEEWYKDALNINFLEFSAYSRLILLYGTKNLITERKEQIKTILKKIAAIEPNREHDNSLYSLYKNLGFAYYNVKDYDQSIDFYKQAIALKPELSSAKVDLAFIYGHADDYESSEQYFMEALKDTYTDSKFDIYWGLGWLYDQKEAYGKAIEYYTKCEGLRKYGEERLFNIIGVIYFKQKQYEESASYYKKAIEINPNITVYFDNLDDALRNSGNDEELEAFYKDLSLRFPENDIYLNRIGVFYHDKGEFETAIQYYDRAIALEPGKYIYLENRGLAHFRLQELKKAEADYTEALKLDQTANLYNSLGRVQLSGHDYESAVGNFKAAINLESDSAIFNSNKAKALEQIGIRELNAGLAFKDNSWLKEAESAYHTAITLSSDDATFVNDLGLFYGNIGEHEKALEMYKKAADMDPDEKVYPQNIAFANEQLGNYKEAEEFYKSVLNKTESEDATAGLIIVQLIQEKYEEVLKTVDKYMEQYKDAPDIHKYKGEALEKLLRYQEALESYKNGLALQPENEYFNNRIGIMHFYLGGDPNFKEAIKFYKKAVELNPRRMVYYKNLELAYQQLDDKKNLKDIHKTIEMLSQNPEALE